jgi:hypothetical protein
MFESAFQGLTHGLYLRNIFFVWGVVKVNELIDVSNDWDILVFLADLFVYFVSFKNFFIDLNIERAILIELLQSFILSNSINKIIREQLIIVPPDLHW